LKNRLLRAWRSRRAREVQSHDPLEGGAAAEAQFQTLRQSRQFCAAIDRGAELRLWDHVDRLAQSASRLSWFDAALAERLARVKVAHGEPETALVMLDRGVNAPPSTRLLRTLCLLHTGAHTQAHLELTDWQRSLKSDSAAALPSEGRLLHALLEWHAGDIASATSLLRDVADDANDDVRRWAQMTLILLAASRGQWDRATDRARTLAESDNGLSEREIALMLDSLRLGRPVAPEQQRHERIEQMAKELPGAVHLIEPLVEAQRRHFDQPVAEELYAALEKSFAVMGEHQSAAAEGLARLGALLSETDEAVNWARRGLALNPMSARLVLLLNELIQDNATTALTTTNREQAA
jgi:tetratricopeptide (TPR) repeat protein